MRRRFLRMALLLIVLLAGVVSTLAGHGASATERPAAPSQPIPSARVPASGSSMPAARAVVGAVQPTSVVTLPLIVVGAVQPTPAGTFPITVSLEWHPGATDSLP